MLTLVSRPETVPPDFGIPTAVGVPDRYRDLLRNTPDDVPYAVVRECWDGLTAYAGPMTQAQVDAIPACSLPPDPDPARTLLDVLRAQPINLAALEGNLDYLAAYLGDANVAAVGQDIARLHVLVANLAAFHANATPTTAQAVAAVKDQIELTVAVQRVTLAVLADVIRYVLRP
jgi:hypothetical protein